MRMTKELRTHKRWEREQSFKSSLRIVQKKKKKKEGKKDEGRLGRRRVGSCPGRNPLIDWPSKTTRALNERATKRKTQKTINSNHHKYQRDCTLFCASRSNRSFSRRAHFTLRGSRVNLMDDVCLCCACSRLPFHSIIHQIIPPPILFYISGVVRRPDEWMRPQRFY